MRVISGLLSAPPAIALQLDDFAEELYSDDMTGAPIEDLVPIYSILDQIAHDYVYPVHDAYFAYASRVDVSASVTSAVCRNWKASSVMPSR